MTACTALMLVSAQREGGAVTRHHAGRVGAVRSSDVLELGAERVGDRDAVEAVQLGHVPGAHVVDLGRQAGDVLAVPEHRIGQAAQRLPQRHHVAAGGEALPSGDKGLRRTLHPDAVVDHAPHRGARRQRVLLAGRVHGQHIGVGVGDGVRHVGGRRLRLAGQGALVARELVAEHGHAVRRGEPGRREDAPVVGCHARFAVVGRLHRLGDEAVEHVELRRVERFVVLEAIADAGLGVDPVSVRDLDLDRRVRLDGLLHRLGLRQLPLDGQVPLVVGVVRRRARVDDHRVVEAVQVAEHGGMPLDDLVHDGAHLGLGLGDEVAVEVEAVGVGAVVADTAVGVGHHVDEHHVVAQDGPCGGVVAEGQLAQQSEPGVDAGGLVAVDAAVDEHRYAQVAALVQHAAGGGGVAEHEAQEGLVAGLGLRRGPGALDGRQVERPAAGGVADDVDRHEPAAPVDAAQDAADPGVGRVARVRLVVGLAGLAGGGRRQDRRRVGSVDGGLPRRRGGRRPGGGQRRHGQHRQEARQYPTCTRSHGLRHRLPLRRSIVQAPSTTLLRSRDAAKPRLVAVQAGGAACRATVSGATCCAARLRYSQRSGDQPSSRAYDVELG